MKSVNPATGAPLADFEEHSARQVDERLQRAHAAFLAWREVPFPERAKRVRRAAEILRARRDEYAQRMALEMGKPLRDGRQEIDKCAWCADHYAEHAESFLAPE